MKLYRGMEVGVLQRVEDPAGYEVGAVDESQEKVTELDKQEMLQALVENSSAELSPGEKDHLLLSYADVMACSTSELVD